MPLTKRMLRAQAIFSEILRRRSDQQESGEITVSDAVKLLTDAKGESTPDEGTVLEVLKLVADAAPDISMKGDILLFKGDTFYGQQQSKNQHLKADIANFLAEEDEPLSAGVSLCSSTGSTVAMVVKALYDSEPWKYTQLLTNSLGVAEQVNREVPSIEIAGGQFVRSICACVGDSVVTRIRNAQCDVGLIGLSAITKNGQFVVSHEIEVPVLYEIIRTVQSLCVVLDATKLTLTSEGWSILRLPQIFEKSDRLLKVHIVTNELGKLRSTQMDTANDVLEQLKEMLPKEKLTIHLAD